MLSILEQEVQSPRDNNGRHSNSMTRLPSVPEDLPLHGVEGDGGEGKGRALSSAARNRSAEVSLSLSVSVSVSLSL